MSYHPEDPGPGKRKRQGRPTEADRLERLAATEELILAGWSRNGALELARRFKVTASAVRKWRLNVREDIKRRSRPGATQAESLEDVLEQLRIVYERALAAGKLNTARACLWDRARLLGLGAPTRVQVQAQIDASLTIEPPAARRRDVSGLPAAVLLAAAQQADDAELTRLLETAGDEPIEVEAVAIPAADRG